LKTTNKKKHLNKTKTCIKSITRSTLQGSKPATPKSNLKTTDKKKHLNKTKTCIKSNTIQLRGFEFEYE